ncbi:MAG: hypothetical protein M3174_06250 [Actinomycetota bacterium]|nr:hypothetical protein [Actinomycetota bacterium]
MAWSERQRAKVLERMQAPQQALLHDDENPRVRVHAQSPFRVWPVAIPSILVAMWLATQGLEPRAWVMPVSWGVYFALTMRFFYVIATDRRILVVRLGAFSSKRWSFEGEIALTSIESLVYEDRVLQDRFTIYPNTGKRRRYLVVKGWEDDARRLAELAPIRS